MLELSRNIEKKRYQTWTMRLSVCICELFHLVIHSHFGHLVIIHRHVLLLDLTIFFCICFR